MTAHPPAFPDPWSHPIPQEPPACRHLDSLPKFCPYYLAKSQTYSDNMVHPLGNGATGDPCLGLGDLVGKELQGFKYLDCHKEGKTWALCEPIPLAL